MATWEAVRKVALALPEVTERSSRDGVPEWRVKGALFAWERPLRRKDLEELGRDAPKGSILAVRVADEGVKEALVAEEPDVFFTTSHFDGYPAVLIRLARIRARELEELLVDAWLERAPKRLAKDYLDSNSTRRSPSQR